MSDYVKNPRQINYIESIHPYMAGYMGNYITFDMIFFVLKDVVFRLLIIALTILSCYGSTGVNFIPQNKFYSTYSMWALSFSIDMQPYFDQLHATNATLSNLRSNVMSEINSKREYLNDQINNNVMVTNTNTPNGILNNTGIRQMFDDLGILKNNLNNAINDCELQTTYSINRLISILRGIKEMYTMRRSSSVRQKRSSILPWGGDLLKSLFGTATDSDLQGLREKLASLSANQGKLVHVVQGSLSMINKTNTVASQNRHATNTLINDVTALNRRLSNLQNMVLNEQKLNRISQHLTFQVNSIIRSITTTIQGSKLVIHQLSRDLEHAMRGELSTTLVNSVDLRELLADIEQQLPETLELKDYSHEKVMWYYRHLPVITVPDHDQIHIITSIPLIPSDSLFTLYKVVVLPLPVLNTNDNSQIQIEGTHFAISSRGNTFIILDNDEIRLCSNSELTFCPLHRAAMNLARTPSCIGSLFQLDQEGIKKQCTIRVTSTQKFPIFRHLLHGKWMVATRKMLVIHPRCDNSHEYVTSIQVMPPVKIITLESGCTGYSEFATLPPYFYQTSDESDHIAHYGLLNVGHDMKPIYSLNETMYNFDFRYTNTNPIQSRLMSEATNLNMTSLRDKLNSISRNRVIVWTSDGLASVVGSACALILLIVLIITSILIYTRYYKKQTNKSGLRSIKDNSNNKTNYSGSMVDQGRVVACSDGSVPVGRVSTLLGTPSMQQLDFGDQEEQETVC